MKRFLSILIMVCLACAGIAWAGAAGEDISSAFTDENFRAAVYKTLGKQAGQPITAEECAAVEELKCGKMNISSMNGLEYFTSLKVLVCYDNELERLDLTHNGNLKYLDCAGNRIPSKDDILGLSNLQLDEFYFFPQRIVVNRGMPAWLRIFFIVFCLGWIWL